jgi:hypothetical protein
MSIINPNRKFINRERFIMEKISTKTTELQLVSGHVVYGFELKDTTKNTNEEEMTFSDEFYSLKEMMSLISTEKLQVHAMIRGARNVWVESIGFISRSEDGKSQVETLMMEDENFVELMQR